MMPNSPKLCPHFPPNITIKKYQFRIDQDSTRIDNKKSKRNCDTKQQTEALSQPLSSLSKKNMVVKKCECVIKRQKNKLFCECDCVVKLACVPAHSDFNMSAQRVVDAVCKTKENICARLSLRCPWSASATQRYLSAQLRPLSSALKISPPEKKTNNYSNQIL
jgi:hypothetical protein